MVNVDTVYQRVLTIANKEQRGYITPLEFNLLANQVQLEIFEEYFPELNQSSQLPGVDMPHVDAVSIIEDKISIFQQSLGSNAIANLPVAGGNFRITLPEDVYRIITVYCGDAEAEKLNSIHFSHVKKHGPLTKPTAITPVYNLQKNHLRMHNGNPIDPSLIDCGIHYIRKPEKVEWGYVVTDGQALYNASASTDFELHGSDETILIGKILGLAGVIMQKPDLAGAGQQQA